MSKASENKDGRVTATLRPISHKKAQLASTLENKSMVDFVSEAIDLLADPILERRGIKVSAEDIAQPA